MTQTNLDTFIPKEAKNRPDKRTLTVSAETHMRLKELSTQYGTPINRVITALLDAYEANS